MDVFPRGLYTDVEAVNSFCGGEECIISRVYDQSGRANDLAPSPPGSGKPTPSSGVNAKSLPVTLKGHGAYGMLFLPGMGYRAGCHDCMVWSPDGMPIDDEPETIYMVTSQVDLVDG